MLLNNLAFAADQSCAGVCASFAFHKHYANIKGASEVVSNEL